MWVVRVPVTPWKISMAISFLRNSDNDVLKEAMWPIGCNCFSKEDHTHEFSESMHVLYTFE